ncbi:CUN058 similar to AcMNPV ORF68 [Culex nigripalpus nucleopolyhedrovirus]|uniref:CUN058 similar to AcMNPV ORF68 n=1 Tax=Culex nigripalpus nucleopolyhedrovirus (isolate Florida/1997) TaxID=645993 RepID=Q919L8_NPVCO|nr:CUN058 similar to AcMNPV ORF68 [Culex nigripalpus nucleopolyhedrovirus]AAK94136.1 CUN058 similar to AcMNPV ORF68 [Culex nigripalpus nucleopolyhedrovirus]
MMDGWLNWRGVYIAPNVISVHNQDRESSWAQFFTELGKVDLNRTFRLGLTVSDVENFDYHQPLFINTKTGTVSSIAPVESAVRNIQRAKTYRPPVVVPINTLQLLLIYLLVTIALGLSYQYLAAADYYEYNRPGGSR